jgi:gamma-glutamylaminecyclotransferase
MVDLFVFGTLKRTFPLHDEWLAGARYLGRYRTVERFPMLVAGPWFAPMMLDEPGQGLQVYGEVYAVEAARLPALDALESVGQPGHFRRHIAIEAETGGGRREAFAYMKARSLATPAHSGLLADYQDRRFIPPARR